MKWCSLWGKKKGEKRVCIKEDDIIEHLTLLGGARLDFFISDSMQINLDRIRW
jgi:hypothetical protein